MPNFLIVGAQKAGTTALYNHLSQHPQVYMSPNKEPHFFAFEGKRPDFRGPRDEEVMDHIVVSDLEAYERLFDGARGERAVGEASAMYLYSEEAVEGIRRHVPRAKLVAVLRDPVQRAYSSFLHLVRDGREPLEDFGEALAAEEGRIRDNWAPLWHYKHVGFYHAQLVRYYEAFGPEQIRVYLHEDLDGDPVGVLEDVYSFLGVEASFFPDVSARYNASGVPKSGHLHSLYGFLLRPHPAKAALRPFLPGKLRRRLRAGLLDVIRNRNLVRPPLSEEVRAGLIGAYREDVLRLQELIGRDLSHWLR